MFLGRWSALCTVHIHTSDPVSHQMLGQWSLQAVPTHVHILPFPSCLSPPSWPSAVQYPEYSFQSLVCRYLHTYLLHIPPIVFFTSSLHTLPLNILHGTNYFGFKDNHSTKCTRYPAPDFRTSPRDIREPESLYYIGT